MITPILETNVHDFLAQKRIAGGRCVAQPRPAPGCQPDLPAVEEDRARRLPVEVPEIVELDLNPVIALSPGNGCRIVDARVKVRPPR